MPGDRSDVVEASVRRAPLPAPEDRAAILAALGPLAVIDLETTGLDPDSARVIEVGAVFLAPGREPILFHRFVDPRQPLPAFTQHLTGLRDEDLAGAPGWEAVARELARLVAGASVVAHNAAFERAFLAAILPQGTGFLDTLELACVLRPELDSHSLDALSREILHRDERHRALDDALDTLALLCRLGAEVREGEHPGLATAIEEVAPGWPWARLAGVPTHLGPLGASARRREASARAPRAAPARSPDVVGGELPPGGQSREGRRIPAEWYDADFVRGVLSDEARWRRFLPEYVVREGQIDLACSILQAFREERAFAAEAGTGIGKTLAYALPAVLHALHTGERVVVSSANRTLQERVVREEVPRIAAVLGIAAPSAVILKGRANYPNPVRAREIALRAHDLGFGDLAAASRLYLLTAMERRPGRDLVGFGGWLASRDPLLWASRDRIACDHHCDERRCRALAQGACAYLRRVDALGDSAVVSVNHALLLNWPARYGPIDRLVVDEAHELAAEGDRAFAEEAGSRELRSRLAQLGSGGRGLAASLAATAMDPDGGRVAGELVRRCGERIEEVGRTLFAAAGTQESLIPPGADLDGHSKWRRAADTVESLAAELSGLGAEIERLVAEHRALRSGQPDDAVAAEAASLGAGLAAAGRGLIADLFAQARPDTVYSVRTWRRPDGNEWSVRATPLEVAALIHARLFETARTVIAVSATLGVGGDPSASLDKMGWNEMPSERRLRSVVIESPFDFRRQAILAFVRGDGYRDRRFAERCASAIVAVAELLRGRTLALFTSRQRLMDVSGRMAPLLAERGLALLTQQRAGGAARLVEQFTADPRAVLAGTRSLWQGVDVPGEGLSCVVIDKLPFPPPDDPISRGRAERIREAGGDPFRTLSLEPAVIGFKQMFGRLIRGEADRGFVLVLGADPTKAYIADFIASLPGPPEVLFDDFENVLEEMRRFFPETAAGVP